MRAFDPRKRKSIRDEALSDLGQKMGKYEISDSISPMRVSHQVVGLHSDRDDQRQKTADNKTKEDYHIKVSKIEKQQQQVAILENTNKQLFEKYSKNEKKLVLVLKKVKEENQTLLRNLKKLLAKPNIETRMMLENPAYSKFLAKMKERRKKAGTATPDTKITDLEKKIKEQETIIKETFEIEMNNINKSVDSVLIDNKAIFGMMNRSFQPPTWLKALMHAQKINA